MSLPLCITDIGQLGQRARAISARGQLSNAVEWFEASAWDHVVYDMSDLPAVVAGQIALTSGSWAFVRDVDLGTVGLQVPTGVSVLLGGRNGATLKSVTVLRTNGMVLARGLNIEASVNGIIANGGNSDLRLYECAVSAGTRCVSVRGQRLVVVGGCLVDASAGVFVSSDIGKLVMVGTCVKNCTTGVQYSAGAVRSALIDAVQIDGQTGIDWAAASVPALGMAIVGCEFDCSVADFSGFTAASARVNVKACHNAAGLMSETAIVP